MSILKNHKLCLISTLILVTSSPLIANLPVLAKSTVTDDSGTIEVSIPSYIIAASQRVAFTVISTSYYSSSGYITVKSVASGKKYDVYYGSPIGTDVGDVVTIIINDDRWTTIINERTGKSAGISRTYAY
ncbi:exported hypothetical protein [Planktothrix serta PCC 8927]|uniref:SH3b domain-containing protein n=1 Tax=Planktothrix serta PCC 8927 TaxID=671068 RepID=A0A7Z9E3K3_9CYAN|nr:hypothetical protein [Planktothrix serta]VXD21626.1 exported hypothetical protein [Planktothrix serta PCC 8927]